MIKWQRTWMAEGKDLLTRTCCQIEINESASFVAEHAMSPFKAKSIRINHRIIGECWRASIPACENPLPNANPGSASFPSRTTA
jgi:hypothetical protein